MGIIRGEKAKIKTIFQAKKQLIYTN